MAQAKKAKKDKAAKVDAHAAAKAAHRGLVADPATCSKCGEPFDLEDGLALIPEGAPPARTFRHADPELCL